MTARSASEAAAWPAFRALVARDVRIAVAQGGGGLHAVVFFALVITLVPFGLGPDLPLLQRIAPGMLWVALVLASLLTLDRLFQADFEDGTLDGLFCSALPLEGVVLAKAAAHWLTTALPLIVAAPVLALLLNLQAGLLVLLLVTFLAGTPGLILIGAVGAALTVGVRRAGLLIALLVVPLYVPVLIFAVGAMDRARLALEAGQAVAYGDTNVLLLVATSLFASVVGTVAAAAALRLHLSS